MQATHVQSTCRFAVIALTGVIASLTPSPGSAQSTSMTAPPSTATAGAAPSSNGKPVAMEAPPVVVLTAPSASTILPLLRAELSDLGVEVIERDPRDESREPEGSVIGCRITVNPGTIEVSILDRRTGRLSIREIFTQAESTAVDAQTAVLHVVELLRWHLQGTRPTSRAPELSRVPPPTVAPVERPIPSSSRLLLSALPVSLYSPGGTKPGLGGSLDLAYVGTYVGARLSASALVVPNRLTRDSGTAAITPRLVSASVVIPLDRERESFWFDLDVGLSLVSLRLRGTTKQDYETREDTLLTVSPVVALSAHLPFTRRIGAKAMLSAMMPLRSDEIYFAEQRVGSYGKALFALGLGLEARLD